MLPSLKDRVLKMLYALLRGKSEQEHRLLSTLVNKKQHSDKNQYK
ncbi:hypothetical protein ZOSMA_172G00070 [Zostera marina]|uniref:Uncharacterized protein n=1 Tax=Zostera marina TaxID=29655 RepID=A0A0K9PSB6_ZOSMR|nr:hypothetical protein ZOSMA_172G00070 [Zostera marina]